MSVKSISRSGLAKWEAELRESFDFTYNEEGDKAVKACCKLCRNHISYLKTKFCSQSRGKAVADSLNFVKNGTAYLLKPNLLKHLNSDIHKAAYEKEYGKPMNAPSQTSISQSISSVNEEAVRGCIKLMRTAYQIGLREKPFTDFPEDIELQVANGANLPSSFTDDKSCAAFIYLLAEELQNQLREKLSGCNFFSFLVDGSQAAKKRLTFESELFYVRTCQRGVPKVEFFNLSSTQQYANVTAENLHHIVLRLLLMLLDKDNVLNSREESKAVDINVKDLTESISPFKHKLVGAGSDGASVNFGCRKGMLVKIKETLDIPWFLAIHCFSHRLELAVKDSWADLFGNVNDFLRDIYLHFRNSSAEWANCQKIAQGLSVRLIQPNKSDGTRFVPHKLRSLQSLRCNWSVYVFHFSNVAEQADKEVGAKAKGYLANLLDGKFYLKTKMYEDILVILSQTGKVLQTNNKIMTIANATNEIQSMLVMIKVRELDAGPEERRGIAELASATEVDANEQVNPTRLTRSMGGGQQQWKLFLTAKKEVRISRKRMKLTGESDMSVVKEPVFMRGCDSAAKEVEKIRKKAVEKVIKATEDRFGEFDDPDSVLSHIQWLDSSCWPEAEGNKANEPEVKEIKEFGVEDVKFVFNKFRQPLTQAGSKEDKVLQQFMLLKIARATSTNLKKKNSAQYWEYIFKDRANENSDLLILVELLGCLPFGMGIVENGFSSVRRVITDWRTSLGIKSVNACLHFSVRKGDLRNDFSTREKIVRRAAERFVKGDSGDQGLSRRRINKLLKQIGVPDANEDNSLASETGSKRKSTIEYWSSDESVLSDFSGDDDLSDED